MTASTSSTAPTFTPLAIPWLTPKALELLGSLGVGVDLVVAGAVDAQRLSGSRWHVFGDVAREGRVLGRGSSGLSLAKPPKSAPDGAGRP